MSRQATDDLSIADTVGVLTRCTPFQDCAPGDLIALLPAFHRHTMPAHGVAWQEGDPADRLWFVLDGYLHTVLSSADGDQVVTQVMGPGQSFGEPALFLRDGARISTVSALSPARLLSLEREPLLRFLQQHPEAMRRMLEGMSRMILGQSELYRNTAIRDIRGRVAYQLLMFTDAYGLPGDDGIVLPFTISQTTLAGLVAGTRESVNRALAALTAAGVIAHTVARLTVLDRRRLAAIADGAGRG